MGYKGGIMNKIIVMVGVLDNKTSSNLEQVSSFYNLGFGVIPINYRTIIQRYDIGTFEDILLETVKKYKPFLTIFYKCNGINSEIITQCNEYTNTWLYYMDSLFTAVTIGTPRYPEIIEHAKRTHFSSCTGSDIVEWFTDNGVKNCYHIIQGVDIKTFKPVPQNDKYKSTVSLIGYKTDERDRIKATLERGGFDVKFYGRGYGEEVYLDDFAQVCSSSKIMLSMDSESGIHKGYFSNRLTKYLACGSCVLHYDITGTLNQFFKNGKEIFYFKNEGELITLLNSITDEVAYKVGMDGRERVVSSFTWEHVSSAMLNIVAENRQ